MTKEELEHDHIKEIAENYVNESWGSYLDLDEVDLIMAGIGVGKIIASEQEKRIAELEAQIEQLTYLHNEDVNTIKLLNKQIGKMKDCVNCKYKYIQDSCDLGEGTRTDPCLSCRSNNMWEFDNE